MYGNQVFNKSCLKIILLIVLVLNVYYIYTGVVYTHIYVYVYLYIYVDVYICVRVLFLNNSVDLVQFRVLKLETENWTN